MGFPTGHTEAFAVDVVLLWRGCFLVVVGCLLMSFNVGWAIIVVAARAATTAANKLN